MSHITSSSRQFVSNYKISNLVTKAKRDLILSILRSTTTKREARNFLEKYQDQFDFRSPSFCEKAHAKWTPAELLQRQAVIEKYLHGTSNLILRKVNGLQKDPRSPLRVALFKISIADIPHDNLKGIAETLNRLVQLGVSPIILCDHEDSSTLNFKQKSSFLSETAERLLLLLLNRGKNGLDLIQTHLTRSLFVENTGESGNDMRVDSLELILMPLYQGIVPLILPVIYNPSDGSQRFAKSGDALIAMCSEFLRTPDVLTIEKIIFIDSLGGIPSIERNQTSHVFINLSQEFSDIVSELYIGHLDPGVRESHISNLKSMNEILCCIAHQTKNNSATGIITTPQVMSVNNDQLNPVVYNVLTDRPIISSSLPSALQRTPQVSTSIIKKGFEVTCLDEDSYNGKFTFQNLVNDGQIDKDKLIHLIVDSFGKKLKTEEFLTRIDTSLATLIVVGDYEGAAVITWEYLSNGDKVAYLDKFAIARRNQGIPSLADVIFKLITQSHQTELLWRSRANNPVNKWYFERCRGSVTIQQSPWKFFYAGDIFNQRMGIKLDGTEGEGVDITDRLRLYSELVENLEPSFE